MEKSPEDPRYVADAPTLVQQLEVPDVLIGAVLGQQYQLVEVIGEGGIGVVYRARQLTVNRDVAVKVLRREAANDELMVRRFENEASAIGRLRHPNTLRLFDCQRTEAGELYIVTELLSGTPLSGLLAREGRLVPERALRLVDEVCRSLAEAHAAGIVHRDLKPANIFLDHIGAEDIVKVLDFGIAKIRHGSGITRAGFAPGTPHYMAPEQATAQRVDHRADIYALGVILYLLITGRPPFDGATPADILRKAVTEPPPSFAEAVPELLLPAELEQLVRWMLEKDPEDRPGSVEIVRRHIPRAIAAATPILPLARGGSSEVVISARTPRVAAAEAGRSDTLPHGAAMGAVEPAAAARAFGARGSVAALGLLGVALGVAIGTYLTRSEEVIPLALPLERPPPVVTADAGPSGVGVETSTRPASRAGSRAAEAAPLVGTGTGAPPR